MAAYEILIADDHPLFRSALQQALTLGLGPEVRLVEAASIAELEGHLAAKSDWDLVLLDLNMPGAYGFSGLYNHLAFAIKQAALPSAIGTFIGFVTAWVAITHANNFAIFKRNRRVCQSGSVSYMHCCMCDHRYPFLYCSWIHIVLCTCC